MVKFRGIKYWYLFTALNSLVWKLDKRRSKEDEGGRFCAKQADPGIHENLLSVWMPQAGCTRMNTSHQLKREQPFVSYQCHVYVKHTSLITGSTHAYSWIWVFDSIGTPKADVVSLLCHVYYIKTWSHHIIHPNRYECYNSVYLLPHRQLTFVGHICLCLVQSTDF